MELENFSSSGFKTLHVPHQEVKKLTKMAFSAEMDSTIAFIRGIYTKILNPVIFFILYICILSLHLHSLKN